MQFHNASEGSQTSDPPTVSSSCRRQGGEPIMSHTRLGLKRGLKRDINGKLVPRNQELGFSLHADQIRIARLKELRELLSSLNAKQREDIRAIGFGGILDVKCESLPDGMNEWLINQFNPVSQNFYVDGRIVFCLSGVDAQRIFGLNYAPGNPVFYFVHDEEVSNFIDNWKRDFGVPDTDDIDLYDAISLLRRMRGGGDDFKRMFVLYVMQMLLTPQFGTKLELGLMKSLMDVDNIKNLNWAGYVVDHLCDSMYIFSQINNSKGTEGCLLLLQIAYFHSCIWKGVPPLVEEPLIKHWYGNKISGRILDEHLAGGFGKGWFLDTNQLSAMHYISPIPRNMARQAAAIAAGEEPITLWTDDEISEAIDNEGSRKQWKLLRDVENLIFSNVESRNLHSFELRNACLRQDGNGKVIFNAKGGLDRVMINLFSCCWYMNPGSNVRVGNLLDETFGVADPLHDQELSPIQDCPWDSWEFSYPPKYSSQLVQDCSKHFHTFLPYKLEVADYCVSQDNIFDSSEILVRDGGNLWITRRHFTSMESGHAIQSWVVNMFARCTNYDWVEKSMNSRVAFETLELFPDPDEWNPKAVVWGWRSWINLCRLNIKDASFLLVPVTWRGGYYLVVVDFIDMKIQCIEPREQQEVDTIPEDMVRAIGLAVKMLLHQFRDNRAEQVSVFTNERLIPHWSNGIPLSDSGVCVMYMMERYCGSSFALDLLELDQARKRIQLRVAYSCYMVFSDLNGMRAMVLEKIKDHMSTKKKTYPCLN